MAVTLRSLSSFRIVPAVQVISNCKKQPIIYNTLPEFKLSIIGCPSRSVFLADLLCKRNIGSIPSVKVVERRFISSDEVMPYSPSFEELPNGHVTSEGFYNFKFDLTQIQPTNYNKAVYNEIRPNFPENCMSRDAFISYRQIQSLSLCRSTDNILSEYEKQMILLSETVKEPAAEPPNNVRGRPSPEQLDHILKVLSESLPRLFVQPLDYTIYHPDIIFENNIRGTRTVGLFHYVRQIAVLRMVGHFKFAYVKFDILKITAHPEDGTVKVRWRIRGISGFKVFLNFWKMNILKLKETISKESESWYDGFSIFYVNSDGKVYKHLVDKMQPDPEEKVDVVKPLKSPLATKLALILGLSTRDCLDMSQLLSVIHESSQCLSNTMLPLDKIA